MSSFRHNLSWIFFGNIAHAILQFLLNVYCARKFGADDFGIFNYCASLIAFFTAVCTLGFNGVITKYFAKNEDRSGEYLGTTILSRIIVSLFSIVLLQLTITFDAEYSRRLVIIVLAQSLQILFGSLDLFVYWFRYKNQAKNVAIIRLIAFGFSAIWRIIAIHYYSLTWYSFGVSFEFLLFGLFLWNLYKKYNSQALLSFNIKCFKEVFQLSYPFILSAILATIYGQTDKIMLRNMVDYTSVGLYSVSLTLAGAVSIIPIALIEGFRPDIMSFKEQHNNIRYEQRLIQLYGLVFWICVAYCIFISVFAKPIILILYGDSYIDAVSSLSIIVWYTSFSYFGAINNMFMVAEGKTFWVQIITLIGAVLNVILNFLLIPKYGIVGAAVASLITQFVANYLCIWIIKPLRKCFKFLNQGIVFPFNNILSLRFLININAKEK